MKRSRLFDAYIIPICVFQSLAIAGGYGTGREIVEFFTSSGVYGGLYGIAISAIVIAIFTALTFEFGRIVNAYDYRTFLKALIGKYWIGFEILYSFTFFLILAVVGSAAGNIFSTYFGISEIVGLAFMLIVVAILAFYGRRLVEKTMVVLTLFLYLTFIYYFIESFSAFNEQIFATLVQEKTTPQTGWLLPALKFAQYTSVTALLMLFATRGIRTRAEAFISGGLCSFLYVLPAFLFHVSFLGAWPAVVEQSIPIYWIINQLDVPVLHFIYLIAMIGTFICTGTGFIQASNERFDQWYKEKVNRPLPPWVHSVIAIVGLLASALFAQFGIIALIGKGYGGIAWGMLLVYGLPILILGGHRIFRHGKN